MKYTKEFCEKEVIGYADLKTFRIEKPLIYGYIIKHKWNDIISHLTRSAGSYYRFIYAYEFKDYNSVYVGLTYNIKNRHERHLNSGTVYDFITKHNIKLNEPIILEEKIVYTKAGEREAFYIDLYRENGWNVLNKAKAGGLGSGRLKNKQIVMFNNRGEYVDDGSRIYIIEKYGILGQHISNCLAKRYKSANGYAFMYKTEWEKKGKPKKINSIKTNIQEEIVILNDDLTIQKVCHSKKDAMEYCGYKWRGNNLVQLQRNTIANCNRGKCAFYLDYLKYIDGELELYNPNIPRHKKLYLLPYDEKEREDVLKTLSKAQQWVKNKNLKRLKPFHVDLHKPDDYVSPRAKCLLQFDFDGKFIKEYGSARVFVKKYNFRNGRHISDAANGKRGSAFGFIWIYKNSYTDELLQKKVERLNKNKENVVESPPVNADE